MNKKTLLERFQYIKELEVNNEDEAGVKTVEDVLPYFCKNVEEALQRLEDTKWHLTKDELPNENVYVIIYIPNRSWDAGTSIVFYDIAHVVKGITEEEREKLDDSDKRKITRCFGDEGFGNNLVPYGWQTFGPATYYGQEVVAWAYINEFKGE